MIHDLDEVYAGDVNLWDDNKVSPEDKRAVENLSAKKLFALLPKDLDDKFYALWKEYEDRQTSEAKFVYALDKLQPFIQRIIANDNGWKEKRVDRSKLDEVKPELVKDDLEMSKIWDDLTEEAESKKMLWGQV